MKAIRYHEFGGAEVLRQDEVARPAPEAGHVLVKVTATSFNPVDDHIRSGALAKMIPTPLPVTPGLDIAGTVVELGDGVDGWNIGDPVIAMLPLDVHGGAAEYATVAAELLATAPISVELADAASLPLIGLAARQAVVDLAGINPGQTVLVVGAGGAVGGVVVQLAVDAGATVTAVDRTQHARRLRTYGATHIVEPLDLAAGPSAVAGPFDVVVNHVRMSPDDLAKLTAYVADGGIVVSSAGEVPGDDARHVRSAGVWVAPSGKGLSDLVARVDSGRLELHVANRRRLDELPKVHDEAANGSLGGKTVIVVG